MQGFLFLARTLFWLTLDLSKTHFDSVAVVFDLLFLSCVTCCHLLMQILVGYGLIESNSPHLLMAEASAVKPGASNFPKAIFDLSFLLNLPPTSCESCTLTPFAVANWLCKRCRDVIVIRQNVSYDSAVIQRANQSICYCGLFTEGTLISLLHCHCFGLQLDYHYFEM